jgi:hypothetical protein
MADNYLERHREDYEARKKEWGTPQTASAQAEQPGQQT